MKNKITAKQMEAMIALFLAGSTMISGSSSGVARDKWLCIILAFLLVIPLLWVHTQILELYPGRDYFGNIEKACGKVFGKVVCVLLLPYTFLLGALVKKSFCQFLQTVNLTDTPFIFILLSIVIVEFYMSKKRIYVVARVCKFVLPFLLVTIALTCVLAFQNMDFSNLQPVLQSDFTPMMSTTFLLLMLPFGETLVCAPAFGALDPKEKVFPVFFKGTLIGFAILLITSLRNLLVLGNSDDLFFYASYEAVGVVAIGDFFTRAAVIIGFNMLLAGFFKVCVTFYTCCKEVQKIFNFDDYKPLFAPCGLILVTIIMVVSSNTEEVMNWLKFHALFVLPFEVVIPVAVLIIAKLRKRAKAKKGPKAKVQKKASAVQAPAADVPPDQA
jgi:spore germination protein KB